MEHFYYECRTAPATVEASCFSGSSGVRESHLLIRPMQPGSFEAQLEWIQQAYGDALRTMRLPAETALFRRYFCRDLAHSAALLAACPQANRHGRGEPCAVSWVDQPPMPPANVGLWAYHACDPTGALDKVQDGTTLIWNRHGLQYCWTTGLMCGGRSAYDQTRGVFRRYDALLASRDLLLERDVVRTWLFIDDIDADYAEVVAARREHFREHGMTADTHYIASTGIRGSSPEPQTRLMLDAFAIAGLKRGQVCYLSAPEHMCPTHEYGVTFERGVAVDYRDRRHVLLSGTASIDRNGSIVCPGDLARQVERTMENVAALLARAGATLRDVGVLLAYARDPADVPRVDALLRERCGVQTPIAVVHAAICRPGWLVEVEGVALIPASRAELPAF